MWINKNYLSSQKRPSSGSTVISQDAKSLSISDSLNASTTTFLKQVLVQITRILATECSLTEQNLTQISRLSNLKQALTFLRNFQPEHRQLHFPYRQYSCRHQKELQNLESTCRAKNQAIMKMNQGYQEAKNIYVGDLLAKDKDIMQLKKWVEILQTQNEGLTLELRKLGLEFKKGKQFLVLNNRQPDLMEQKSFLLKGLGMSEVKVRVNNYKRGKEMAGQETEDRADGKWRAND